MWSTDSGIDGARWTGQRRCPCHRNTPGQSQTKNVPQYCHWCQGRSVVNLYRNCKNGNLIRKAEAQANASKGACPIRKHVWQFLNWLILRSWIQILKITFLSLWLIICYRWLTILVTNWGFLMHLAIRVPPTSLDSDVEITQGFSKG